MPKTLLGEVSNRINGISSFVGIRFQFFPDYVEVWGRYQQDDGFGGVTSGPRFHASSLVEGIADFMSPFLDDDDDKTSVETDELERIAREKGVVFGALVREIFSRKAAVGLYYSIDSEKIDGNGEGENFDLAVLDCLNNLRTLS